MFFAWLLPAFAMVTGRIIQLFKRERFTGVRFTDLGSRAFVTPTLSPGRLVDWLPPEKLEWLQSQSLPGNWQ